VEAIGGKGVNQTLAAARMGAPVALVACLGDDHAGRSALRAHADGVNTTRGRIVSEPTGRAAVLVDAARAQRDLVSARGQRAAGA
jgi:ribokinase